MSGRQLAQWVHAWRPGRPASSVLTALLLAAAYVTAAKLGFMAAAAHGVVSSAWPPTGLALAALLLLGPRVWPGIALGAFLANALSGVPFVGAVGIAAGNTLEAVAGTWLLRRVAAFRPSLERLRDVLALFGLAGLVSTTISATIGVTSLALSGAAPPASYGALWAVWWSGDAIGVLVLAPALLTWAGAPRPWAGPRWLAEGATVLLLLGLLTAALFRTEFGYVYAVFPVAAWAAVRLGPRGGATATLLVSVLAIAFTLQGVGPFATSTATHNLFQLQTFMALLALTTLGFAAVIAERRRAEQELRLSEAHLLARTDELHGKEERLRTVTDTAHDAIISANRLGNVTYWNPGAARIFGYPAEEVVGRPLTLLMPARYHDPHRQGLARYLATGEARVVGRTVELAGRRKDGTEFPLELSLAASGTGDPTFTGIIRDITERKSAESTLRESNAELEAFTYTVSHDLRAPLRAMQGFAQALLEDYGRQLDPKAQDYCRRIVNAAGRMDELIQDLLAYSRLGRAELVVVPVSLEAVVRDALGQLDGVVKERKAQVTVEPRLPAVMGHHATMVQALANLIGNGIKFVAPETAPRVRVWAERRARVVRIWVEDNGIGIALEHQERIFRVFERLHQSERYAGTGIGLAMVKRSVERMGGRVGVISNPGTGSRFWIDLPVEGPA